MTKKLTKILKKLMNSRGIQVKKTIVRKQNQQSD